MGDVSEICHVRMFLNLQSDLEGKFMLHVEKQLGRSERSRELANRL